jgi:hypothetical protein
MTQRIKGEPGACLSVRAFFGPFADAFFRVREEALGFRDEGFRDEGFRDEGFRGEGVMESRVV